MDAERFWEIIEQAKHDTIDSEKQVEHIYAALKTLPPDEIIEFDYLYDDYRFQAYRWDLWGAAHVMNDGCSDDGFEYFRGWLISRGRAVYEKALSDPDSLTTEFDPQCDAHELESLLGITRRAYEHATGNEIPARDRTFPKIAGEQWNADDLDAMLPRLTARFKAVHPDETNVLDTLCDNAKPSRPKGSRMAALYTLGFMGTKASDAIPLLNELLHDDDEQVRQMANKALQNIADN
jgi:hypothetical protein